MIFRRKKEKQPTLDDDVQPNIDIANEDSDIRNDSKDPHYNPDEAQWVAKAKRGDRVAFAKIVEAYQGPIYNLCYRMLRHLQPRYDHPTFDNTNYCRGLSRPYL